MIKSLFSTTKKWQIDKTPAKQKLNSTVGILYTHYSNSKSCTNDSVTSHEQWDD